MANNLIQYLDVTLDSSLKVVGSTTIGTAVRLSDGAYKLRVHAAGINANTMTCYLACELPNTSKTQLKIPFDLTEGFTFEKTENGVDYYLATIDINVAALKYVGKVNCNIVVVTNTGETTTSGSNTYAVTTLTTSGTFTIEVTRSSNYSEILYTDDDEYSSTEVHVDSILQAMSNYSSAYLTKAKGIQSVNGIPSDVSSYNGMYLLDYQTHKLYYVANNTAKELIDLDDILTTAKEYSDGKLATAKSALDTTDANMQSQINTLQSSLTAETTNRTNTDVDLQSAIDNKLDKTGGKAYNLEISQRNQSLSDSIQPAVISDITNAIDNLKSTYSNDNIVGLNIVFDEETYKIKIEGTTESGATVESNEIDLPSESSIISITKNKDNDGLIFELRNGNKTEIPLGDLISNFVTQGEITDITAKVEEVNECLANEATRKANEEARVTAENTRISNETSRGDNESTRVSNESTRQTNESTRQSQESTRQSNEATRIANENTRIANEQARAAKYDGVDFDALANVQEAVENLSITNNQTSVNYSYKIQVDSDGQPQLVLIND